MIRFFLFSFVCLFGFSGYAQAGLAATPVKFYYTAAPGSSETQFITISNPTDVEVEVGVSFGDWKYNKMGNNQTLESGILQTSAADWIKVLPSSYFVLQPHERKRLEMVLSVPTHVGREVPVHTALVYFSQLNPSDGGVDQNGAAIRVTVKMAVKIYHSLYENSVPAIEITDFNTFENETGKTAVYLTVENQGKIWTDGEVSWELFNQSNGKKTKLDPSGFYTLPGDMRRIERSLPTGLPKGKYTLTAIVKYGDSDVIKVADLGFGL